MHPTLQARMAHNLPSTVLLLVSTLWILQCTLPERHGYSTAQGCAAPPPAVPAPLLPSEKRAPQRTPEILSSHLMELCEKQKLSFQRLCGGSVESNPQLPERSACTTRCSGIFCCFHLGCAAAAGAGSATASSAAPFFVQPLRAVAE